MLDHHLQREIHFRLLHSHSLRFSELQPEGVENKLFDYHLKKTLRSGLVQKNTDGSYSLTPTGRRIGSSTLSQPSSTADKAYSLLLFGLQRPDGAWLTSRRSTHPQIDRIGLPQQKPTATKTTLETGHDYTHELGIDTTLTVHAHGFLKVFDDNDEVESFIHFTLLKGSVTETDQSLPEGYLWVHEREFSTHDMLPSTEVLLELLRGPAGSFADETFHLSS